MNIIQQIKNTISNEEWNRLVEKTAKKLHEELSSYREPLVVDIKAQDKHSHGLGITLATDKALSLSKYEYEQTRRNEQGDSHIQSWLASHHHSKPYKYRHSHSIDRYLTAEELERWNRWQGWSFDFERCLVWNSRGKQVEPTKRADGRLVVNGQSLSWVIMAEWLARTNQHKAVGLLKHKYQVHHRKPNLLGTVEGNKLKNLLLVTEREHYLLDNMQRKARQMLKK